MTLRSQEKLQSSFLDINILLTFCTKWRLKKIILQENLLFIPCTCMYTFLHTCTCILYIIIIYMYVNQNWIVRLIEHVQCTCVHVHCTIYMYTCISDMVASKSIDLPKKTIIIFSTNTVLTYTVHVHVHCTLYICICMYMYTYMYMYVYMCNASLYEIKCNIKFINVDVHVHDYKCRCTWKFMCIVHVW